MSKHIFKIVVAIAFIPAGLLISSFDVREPAVSTKSTVVHGAEISEKYLNNAEEKNLLELRQAVLKGERPLRVVSYNLHKCRGLDGRRDPDRAADAISSLNADIVALQEVMMDNGGPSAHLLRIAKKTGMYAAIPAPLFRKPDGLYGNALLSRFPVTAVKLHVIGVGKFETRGVIDADVQIGDKKLQVLATHMGLRRGEQSRQADYLLQIMSARRGPHYVLMGDFNDWNPLFSASENLKARLGKPFEMKTYPAFFPVLALDKIWASPDLTLQKIDLMKYGKTSYISDHRPVAADVDLSALLRRREG